MRTEISVYNMHGASLCVEGGKDGDDDEELEEGDDDDEEEEVKNQRGGR